MNALPDISIMGPCACGGGPREPNYESCERCRLVYFVLLVRDLRDAHDRVIIDRTKVNAINYHNLRRRVDQYIERFTARPESTLFDESISDGAENQ